MIISIEHGISTAYKTEKRTLKKKDVSCLLSDAVFIVLRNIKMATIVAILTFVRMIKSMFNVVEHEKSFITSGPWLELSSFHSTYHR